MSLIKLPQIQNGARLAHANTKKYNVQKFPMTDTATTEFTITNKPDNTDYTQIYDTNDGMAQIEINHNMYYQDEDFTFDKSSGKIVWTNTAANKGFDLTKNLCDSIRILYAYTYEKILNHNRYVFNKNNNIVGPINFYENKIMYTLHGDAKNPLFWLGDENFNLNMVYDSTVSPAINKELDNTLFNSFYNYNIKLTLQNDSSRLVSFEPFQVFVEDNSCYVLYNMVSDLQIYQSLKEKFDNGENIVIEFIER